MVPDTSLLHDFYSILDMEQDASGACRATLELNPAHPIFKGHFPGMPVVPGVCMLQMSKELLERALGSATRLTTARNIKFLQILNPDVNKTVRLELTFSPEESGDIRLDSRLSTPDESVVFFKMKGNLALVPAAR